MNDRTTQPTLPRTVLAPDLSPDEALDVVAALAIEWAYVVACGGVRLEG